MFPSSFTLTNLSSSNVVLDTKFSEDRALRRNISRGQSLTIAPSIATLDELDSNPEIRQLISAGDLKVSMTQGPLVAFRFEVAADVGTDAAAVRVGTLPFDLFLTGVTLSVPTGVGSSTLQLADAASGGNNLTGAEDTDGTPAIVEATLTATRLLNAGQIIWGLQSATAKPAVSVFMQGFRLSI